MEGDSTHLLPGVWGALLVVASVRIVPVFARLVFAVRMLVVQVKDAIARLAVITTTEILVLKSQCNCSIEQVYINENLFHADNEIVQVPLQNNPLDLFQCLLLVKGLI